MVFPICIEYDGDFPGSHFRYYDEETLLLHLDTIKNEYRMDNEILMFRIPHTCFNKNSNRQQVYEFMSKQFEILAKYEHPVVYYADPAPYEKRDTNLINAVHNVELLKYMFI